MHTYKLFGITAMTNSISLSSVVVVVVVVVTVVVTVVYVVQRQKSCTSLIERDDRFRHSVGLSTPSLDDIRAMRAVKQIRGTHRKSLLTRLGVLERHRPVYRRDSRDYNRDRNGGYDRRRRFCLSLCLSVCLSVLALSVFYSMFTNVFLIIVTFLRF